MVWVIIILHTYVKQKSAFDSHLSDILRIPVFKSSVFSNHMEFGNWVH